MKSIDQQLKGCQLRLQSKCFSGHTSLWQSSADIGQMAEVNLLCSAAILFSGSTFTEISGFFSGTRMPIHLAFDVLQKSSSLSHSCHFQILQRRAGSNYGRASREKQFSYGDGRWAVRDIGLIDRR